MYQINTLLIIFMALPVKAQLAGSDLAPGASCSGYPTGAKATNADSALNGNDITLICNGSTWQLARIPGGTVINTTVAACTGSVNGAIRYNTSTPCLEFCNGSVWQCIAPQPCGDMTPNLINFSDNASATASALTLSNILQVTGITCQVNVTVSGGGSPQFRICSDSGCTSVIHDWTTGAAPLNNNEYIQLRLTASAAGGDTRTALLFVGNAAEDWNVTTTGGDCTVPSPAPGTICADGTVYAGMSPDGNVKMYTTRCDEGMTWNGATCTGSRVSLFWNNGNSFGWAFITVDSVSGETTTAVQDSTDSDTVTGGFQPHQAAKRCADLNFLGHTDWYLPAIQELDVLYLNSGAIGNFEISSGRYWSSTASANGQLAELKRFDNGVVAGDARHSTRLLRCVRR